ncbi:MAG: FecR domain-containing protein [Flammeovirgaceae bacterium]|nr:FecR domain-containing protein [Flammeovirgaceae bacterium]
MNFKDYNIADFVSDESFQNYCLKKDSASTFFWERWIIENPEKKDEVDEAALLLKSLKFNGDGISGLELKQSKDKVRTRLENQFSSRNGKIVQLPKRKKIFNFSIAASVSILILISASFLAYKNWDRIGPQKNETSFRVKYIEKVIPMGKKSIITLGDGTKIKINGGTKLIVPERFGPDKRELFLEGEAFFQVARDEKRPFTIYTGNIATKVLGTSFNIKAYPQDERIQVAVASGKVSVAKETGHQQENPIYLKPNQKVDYNKEYNSLKVGDFDVEEVFSWRDNIIRFKDASFDQVVDDLERWYGVEFQVKKNEINGGYSGEYKNKSLENVLEGVSFALKFKYKIEEKIVIIY